MKIDFEIDFHGYTVAQMRDWLERIWASRRWNGLQRVRVIHGKGLALSAEARRWCDEKGIPWAPEPGNPGALFLYPARRAQLPPARANRPIARQRHRLPLPTSEARRQSPPAEPGQGSASGESFAAELDRLREVPRESLLRKKHS